MLPCNVGEAVGDVGPAGEHHPFDLRADRRECGADAVAAIEQGDETGLWHAFARRRDQGSEPARTRIATCTERAGQHDTATGSRSCSQSRDRVAERMDDDDWSIPVTRLLPPGTAG